jgi:hypothetical protein
MKLRSPFTQFFIVKKKKYIYIYGCTTNLESFDLDETNP